MISYKRDVLERQSLSEVKIGRGSPICERMRKKIEYFKNNFPQCQIAKTLQISSSTVYNIIKRFRETGEISVRKGQGRRPLLDACGLWALRWHCITHRHDSVIDITKWAQEYFQKPLLVNTIHRAICRCQVTAACMFWKALWMLKGVYKGFRATYPLLQTMPISGKALCISAGQCKTIYCSYYNSMAP